MEIPSDPGMAQDGPSLGRCRRTLKCSAIRKHIYSEGELDQVCRMRTADPGGRTLLGLFLEIVHSNPQQSPPVGDGGVRLVSLPQATTSVPEGAIGIPLLFLCPSSA